MSEYTLNSFDGYILTVEGDRLLMKRDCTWGAENLIVTISEDTKILDVGNGYPILREDMEAGIQVRVYVGEAMTMSLPPITNGDMILYGRSADGCSPIYAVVKSVEKTEDEPIRLVFMNGMEVKVDENTTLLPYLTRNLIRKEDLTPGRRILIWPDAENASRAQKIILFMD